MTVASHPPEEPPNAPEVEAAFQAAPPEVVAEILDGELVLMPRPRPRHGNAADELYGELRGPFRLGRGGPGGWVLLIEPEVHLGRRPQKVVPDLAGWRRKRFPFEAIARDADDEGEAHVTVPPDWVCEVLSRGTEADDRGRKRRIYRQYGVAHDWLLDPRRRELEVLRLDGRRWVEVDTFEGDARVRAEPFDAIELDLGALWRW